MILPIIICYICKTLLPSILTGTPDIAPWLLFKTSLIYVWCFRNIPTIFCCFVLSYWFVQKGVVSIIFTDHYSSIFTFQSFLHFGLCEFWTCTSCIWVSLTFQRTFLIFFLWRHFSEWKCFLPGYFSSCREDTHYHPFWRVCLTFLLDYYLICIYPLLSFRPVLVTGLAMSGVVTTGSRWLHNTQPASPKSGRPCSLRTLNYAFPSNVLWTC